LTATTGLLQLEAQRNRQVEAERRAAGGRRCRHTQRRDEAEAEQALLGAYALLKAGKNLTTAAQLARNLGVLRIRQGRLDEATTLFTESLAIGDKTHGPDHPNQMRRLCNLAGLYSQQNRLDDAEPLLVRALGIGERSGGKLEDVTANVLMNLGNVRHARGRHHEALEVYERAAALNERFFGPRRVLLGLRAYVSSAFGLCGQQHVAMAAAGLDPALLDPAESRCASPSSKVLGRVLARDGRWTLCSCGHVRGREERQHAVSQSHAWRPPAQPRRSCVPRLSERRSRSCSSGTQDVYVRNQTRWLPSDDLQRDGPRPKRSKLVARRLFASSAPLENVPPRCCRSAPGAAVRERVLVASRRSPAAPASTTASAPRSPSASPCT
jgi:hypothetical protein